MSKTIVAKEGEASTMRVDMLRYRLLPSCRIPANLRNTRTALHVKLNTLTTESFTPSACSDDRHFSSVPDVVYGAGFHALGMNL
jgi:hypothetical protein